MLDINPEQNLTPKQLLYRQPILQLIPGCTGLHRYCFYIHNHSAVRGSDLFLRPTRTRQARWRSTTAAAALACPASAASSPQAPTAPPAHLRATLIINGPGLWNVYPAHAFCSSHEIAFSLYSGVHAVLCVCILSEVNTILFCFEPLSSQSLDRSAAEFCALYSLLSLQKGGASC